ncbi:hypothetical protein BEI60_16245 [Eisenbergiella tayi]|nr:hypothetical protein BEI60_16245 [Eisenbergiella tayi]
MDFGFYNMDCLEGMKQFPDGYFQLAIVDPPYGINAPKMSMGSNRKRSGDGYPGISTAEKLRKGRLNSGGGKLKNRALQTMDCEWDFKPPGPEYFKELFRVSKNQIIWGGNYFPLPPTRGIIVWDKMQPWENFSQVEIAWTNFDKPAALFRYVGRGGDNQEKKIHPTQKPIELYMWLREKYAKPGYKILDTHVGSASSLIACNYLGYKYVGFELDPGYYQTACQRIENHKNYVRSDDIEGQISLSGFLD